MATFLKTTWLNLVFWTLCVVVTILFSLLGTVWVVGYGLLTRNHRRTQRIIRRAIAFYGATVLRLGWPLARVEFSDLSPLDRGPFVFVSNHLSASDAFLMACVPVEEAIQVVNLWPFKIPWIGWVARWAGYLNVRKMRIESFLEAGTKLLNEGVSVIAFPEGTRSRDGSVGSFHGSALRLAQRAGVAIVPLVLHGNQRTPPRGSLVLRPATIRVHKLAAIQPHEHVDLTPLRLKALVREQIKRHLDELQLALPLERWTSPWRGEGVHA